MGRRGRSPRRGRGWKKNQRWANRSNERWLPKSPDVPERPQDRRERTVAARVRPEPARPDQPPVSLDVRPGTPDGWAIALPVRVERDRRARLAIGVVLVALIAAVGWFEPAFAALPVFGLLALVAVVIFEEAGPGKNQAQHLTVGTPGVRVESSGGDALQVPAGELRDVFWRHTVPGEMELGVRGPNGEHVLARVPTAPPFSYGMTPPERDWVAAVVRQVGRRNQRRAGTEADVPADLRAIHAQQQAEGKDG
jgi:hypothetical protein